MPSRHSVYPFSDNVWYVCIWNLRKISYRVSGWSGDTTNRGGQTPIIYALVYIWVCERFGVGGHILQCSLILNGRDEWRKQCVYTLIHTYKKRMSFTRTDTFVIIGKQLVATVYHHKALYYVIINLSHV